MSIWGNGLGPRQGRDLTLSWASEDTCSGGAVPRDVSWGYQQLLEGTDTLRSERGENSI